MFGDFVNVAAVSRQLTDLRHGGAGGKRAGTCERRGEIAARMDVKGRYKGAAARYSRRQLASAALAIARSPA